MRQIQLTALLVLAVSVQCVGETQSGEQRDVTYWAGCEVAGATFVLELNATGKLRFTPATGVISKGTWKRNANTVEMELNDGFVKLKAEVNGDQMRGVASSKRGLTWKWSARQQPHVVSTAAPLYAPLARAARVSGSVLVDVEIDSLGVVTSIKSVTGHPLLRVTSETAARQYRFQPTADRATRTSRLTFIFTLVNVDHERVKSPTVLSPYHVEMKGGISWVVH